MSGTVQDFPSTNPILIGTRSFAVDTSSEVIRRDPMRHETIPSQRESINLENLPGEGTVNTEGLWRRGQNSWHHGGGQLYLDRKDSDPFRYLYSQGVDIWNQNQATLLPATVQRVDDSGDYNYDGIAVAGQYVYQLQSNQQPSGIFRVRYTTDWVSFTTPTGLPTGTAAGILYLTTNGYDIWASGQGGVWHTKAGDSSWQQIITDAVDNIWFVAQRLIVSQGPTLYDITSGFTPGTPQTLAAGNAYAFMTAPLANSVWTSLCAGESFIYGATYFYIASGAAVSGSVWSFSTAPNGIDLAYGQEAITLEKGEVVRSMYAYENYIFLGSTLGARVCRTVSNYDPSGNAGDLISGPILPNQTQPISVPFTPPTGNCISGFVGWGHWVWFTWANFLGVDGNTYWALGRFDLDNFVAELQPAYASDLIGPQISTLSAFTTGHTVDWDPITNGPVFLVQGEGFWTQDYNSTISDAINYVTTGYIRSGRITWGLTDDKTVAQANLKTAAMNFYAPFDTAGGSVALDVSYDEGSFASLSPLAPNTQANPPVLVDDLTPAEEIEIECILTAGVSGGTHPTRPFLSRWIAKALPNVVSGTIISPVIKLFTRGDENERQTFTDPYSDYAYLYNLYLSQEIIEYQEAPGTNGSAAFTATVVIQQLIWIPTQRRDTPDAGFEGVMVCYMKSIVG